MPKYVVLTLLAVLIVTSIAVAAPATKTFSIDCTNGKTIGQKLNHPAEVLILEIHGFCNERVVIDRPNVTLRGTSPDTDGIVGPVGLDPTNQNDRAMVTVSQGVREVHFENLLISGSEMRGIEVLGTAFISFTGGRISDNGVRGLQVGDGGFADVTDTEISNNGSLEVLAWGGGQVNCLRCAISDDTSWGLGAVEGGRVFLTDSSLTDSGGSFRGMYSSEHGLIEAMNTNVTASAWSLWADRGGQIHIFAGDIAGGLIVGSASQVFLYGVQQAASGRPNFVNEGSYLKVEGGGLSEPTWIQEFATGIATQGAVLGDLFCETGADFFCDGSETKLSSTCGKCP